MLAVKVDSDSIRIGDHLAVSFQRTLRIPDDGKVYPLPPGLGQFPVSRVDDYADRVPATWREHGGVFIPMYQREALWLHFACNWWRACAVKVAVGKVNAISGEPWDDKLRADPQDYLVCPTQPWLDGIKAGEGFIRQFVAMPLGMGYTVEGQVTGKEEFGGIQLMVFDPKPGRFPDEPPSTPRLLFRMEAVSTLNACVSEMGLGAGGRMEQKIYPDEHGIDTWDQETYGQVYVHIVNSMAYREITGKEPPSTPVTARTYTEYGFPWFRLYDEQLGDLQPSEVLANVKSTSEIDKEKGFAPQQDDSTIEVSETQVKKLKLEPGEV